MSLVSHSPRSCVCSQSARRPNLHPHSLRVGREASAESLVISLLAWARGSRLGFICLCQWYYDTTDIYVLYCTVCILYIRIVTHTQRNIIIQNNKIDLNTGSRSVLYYSIRILNLSVTCLVLSLLIKGVLTASNIDYFKYCRLVYLGLLLTCTQNLTFCNLIFERNFHSTVG